MIDVVYCATGWFDVVEPIRAGLPVGASIRLRDRSRPLEHDLHGAHVILPSNMRLDAAAIAAAPSLRLIQQPAAGYDAIDLDAARSRGIPVCNAPGANSSTVVESTLFLMLAVARRLPSIPRAFAERRMGAPSGRELQGKTLGIVGMGRIGSELAGVARALGMHVLGVRSSSPRAELDDLLRRSDIVTLHCPLTPQTRGLIDARAFELMKQGALLLNCARGPIVDRAALEAALASGKLGGVGLDTYWAEPWDPHDPLYSREDVVALPHIGGSTAESFGRIAAIVSENVRRLMAGEELLHRIV